MWAILCLAAGVVLLAIGSSTCRAQLTLGPEGTVQAGGVDIAVVGYSVPSFVDWNEDGLGDLLVGEGGATAKARVYLNVGSASSPEFSGFSYVQSLGSDLTETGSG
jgi:hypothetical protein